MENNTNKNALKPIIAVFFAAIITLALLQVVSATIEVDIDIMPCTYPNRFNVGASGWIPVAILTTGDFDAAVVDPTTVTFGPTGYEAAAQDYLMKDIDEDGDLDLELWFKKQDTGIALGDTEATLRGLTYEDSEYEGEDIVGTDSISPFTRVRRN